MPNEPVVSIDLETTDVVADLQAGMAALMANNMPSWGAMPVIPIISRPLHSLRYHGDPNDHSDVGAIAGDETHREVIDRWSRGDASEAEITTARDHGNMSCPCRGCIQDVYTALRGQIAPQRDSYSPICSCSRCMAWRRDMALAIQGYILGSDLAAARPVQTFEVNMRDVMRNVQVRPDDLLRPTPRMASMTPFERRRAERGHPVPQAALSADWQPNAWEA